MGAGWLEGAGGGANFDDRALSLVFVQSYSTVLPTEETHRGEGGNVQFMQGKITVGGGVIAHLSFGRGCD